MQAQVDSYKGSDVATLTTQIKNLEAELRLAKSQAQKFRQLEVSDQPVRADTEEETLFNVCNHPTMNNVINLVDPRVISGRAAQYLKTPKEIGESVSDTDLRAMLNQHGGKLSKSQFDRIFPKNIALTKLINDVGDGDKNIATDYVECMVTSAQFCVAENEAGIYRTEVDNNPFIAPDGTTASLYAFHSAARHHRGNASLDQGRAASSNPFTVEDLTPNLALQKISKVFAETWAKPIPQLRRAETFDSTVDYQSRQIERTAVNEMNMQGFGRHKTQMCLVIDKPSFGRGAEDVDNASRMTRQVAQLAKRLDDNGRLEVFSHEVGQPTVIDMTKPGDDIKITQSMQKRESPKPDEHISALLQHFYPDDPQDIKYRKMPVFCTLVTKGLTEAKYILLKNTTDLFRAMELPFFLKVININPEISQEEKQRMSHLDDDASGGIDNVDVVTARQPNEITPKNFLREYAGFVSEAKSGGLLTGDQGFDTTRVDIHSEGRSANLI